VGKTQTVKRSQLIPFLLENAKITVTTVEKKMKKLLELRVESGLNYGYETMRGTQEVGRGVFM
jgi:hypothetical protein